MAARFPWLALVLVLASMDAAGARPRRARRTPVPTPTPTATPVPLLKAAGSCLKYEPGHFLVLAEVGQAGRVFRIEKTTVITTKIATGARLRLLYADSPEGPVARKVMPGPVPVSP